MKLLKVLCLIFCSFSLFAAQTKLTLFTFKDIDEIESIENKKSSLASIMTLLEEERKKSSHNFTLLNGDFLSPFCLSGIDKGAHIIDLLNSLKIDLAVLGNHEFDYGTEQLKKRIAESNFKWLASNIIDVDQKLIPGANDIAVYNLDGIKVGFIGLVSQRAANLSKVGEDLYFLPIIEAAKERCNDLLNKKVDVIIALSHLTLDETISLAKEVPQINLIIGGHEGKMVSFYESDTLIYNVGHSSDSLCRIDLSLEKKRIGNENKIDIFHSYRILNLSKVAPNSEILEKIKYYQTKYETLLSEKLTFLSIDLDATFDTLRTKESLFGDIVADAIREKFNADIGFITSGLFRSNHIYHKNQFILKKDVYSELTFNNDLVLLELRGKDLLEVLENSVSSYEYKSSKFPQVSGINFSFDPKKRPFHRIIDVYINDKPIDPDKIYRIATIDFLLKGGDNFISFKKAKILIAPDQNIELIPVVINYLKNKNSLDPSSKTRIIKK